MAFILLALFVLCWLPLTLRRAHRASRRTSLPAHDHDLGRARDRSVSGKITVEDFENEVADALDGRLREDYSERWEIHVHGARPGHSLHIHLP